MKPYNILAKALILMILISLIYSCKNSDKSKFSNGDFIEIKVDPFASKETKLSEIGESIRYVKLETRPECLIGDGRSMRIYKDRILVYQSNSILCFDITGKYLFKIYKKGKGPDEYSAIYDYLINEIENTIEILDGRGMQILRFDLKGKYLDKISIDLYARKFAVIDSSSYYFYTMGLDIYQREGYNFNLFRVKKDGHSIISKHFAQTENMTNYNNSSLSNYKDILSFSYYHYDTIYFTNNTGEVKPLFFVNFGDKNNEIIKELGTINKDNRARRFEIEANKNFIGGISDVSFTEKYLRFQYSVTEEVNREQNYRQGYINEILYSTSTGKFFNIKKFIINDLDGIPLAAPRKIINNELVFTTQAIDITEEMKNNNSPEFVKTIKKLGPINEEDNPVLVFVKIKKF